LSSISSNIYLRTTDICYFFLIWFVNNRKLESIILSGFLDINFKKFGFHWKSCEILILKFRYKTRSIKLKGRKVLPNHLGECRIWSIWFKHNFSLVYHIFKVNFFKKIQNLVLIDFPLGSFLLKKSYNCFLNLQNSFSLKIVTAINFD